MRRLMLFNILMFGSCMSYPALPEQQNQTDSLRSLIEVTRDTSDLIEIQSQLAWRYRDVRPDSSLYFSNQAYALAGKKGLKNQQVQALNYMGVGYRNLGVYSKAFEKYLEALRLAEEYDIDEQRGYALINLGNLYLFQRNFQGAIRYFIQALDQAQALGDRRMQAYCFINLGRSYEGTEEYGQAELYIHQAIDIRKQQQDKYGVIAAEIELADIYRKSGDNDKALTKLQSIINRITREENPRVLILAFNSLSKIYLDRGEIAMAQTYSNRALALAKDVSSRYDERNVLEQMSRIYLENDDYKRAYDYYLNYAELNQQLFSEENIRRIEQLKNQYEIEKQEAENEFLRKQTELKNESINRLKTIIGLTVVGLFLMISVVVFIIRAYLIKKRLSEKIRKQRDKIEEDKSTIELQSVKLRELDQAKSRFFANVSHDLRSPLSLIIGNLEMIREDDESYLTARTRKHLDISYKNSKRLLHLTDEINDITRLEEGKIKLKKESVRINSYLRLLIDMFVDTAEQKGVNMSFQTDLSEQHTLEVDPRQFEKIIYNLVSNAIKYTRKGDHIKVSIGRSGNHAIITVADSGVGIDQVHLPYIFDRFYQSNLNDYQTREGLGIGLALVKDLVELHRGNISVRSTLSKGTEFSLKFPGLDEQSTIGSSSEETRVSSRFVRDQSEFMKEISQQPVNVEIPVEGDRAYAILIVDDHPEIRYYIRQILEDKYHVFEAAHGLEAVDLLKDKAVDLIITDLMMPWMDGFEFIEAINSSSEFKKIPLLVVSARISGEDKEKVLYHGINDYLQKPFSRKELTLRIENLLHQKQKYETDPVNAFAILVKDNLVQVEKDLLTKLEEEVKDKIADPNLNVLMLADALAASERQVYRLVKKLTGKTPNDYIKEVRLQYVDYLIRKNLVKNASEAARSIGLRNVTQFNKQYEKKFGVKPADLLQT